MKTLINGIMEVSKIESGDIKPHMELVDIKEVLEEVWADLKEIARGKDIEFKNIDRSIEIKYDRQKLYTVLKNLIHNSIKFSGESGEISVEVKEHKKFLQIGIKDSGVGIPAGEQDRVFERFYQTRGAKRSGGSGYGLGLSICKNIVRYFGGDIWVESPTLQDNRGCIVWFTIPNPGSTKQ